MKNNTDGHTWECDKKEKTKSKADNNTSHFYNIIGLPNVTQEQDFPSLTFLFYFRRKN